MINKKGLSVVIGYVLLITMAVVMAGVVYVWMKSYVPKDSLECPDGTSLNVPSYFYNCTSKVLNITLKNNGRFDVAGYLIYGSNNSNQNIATVEMVNYLVNTTGVFKFRNAVLLGGENNNSFAPNTQTQNLFNLSEYNGGNILFIEIAPMRWQTEENRLRFVNCGEISKPRIDLVCGT
jgi:hypothetical protein